MEILHIIFSLNKGGSEYLLTDILNKMAVSDKVTLIIINNKYDNSLLGKINKNVRIIKINRKQSSYNLLKILIFNYSIFKIKPDIINVHNENIIDMIFPFLRKNILLTLHHKTPKLKYVKKYHRIFPVSENVRQVLEINDINEGKIIYNGVNHEIFSP